MAHALDLPVARIAAAVRAGEVDAAELIRESLRRIAARNPGLNALVSVDAAGATAAAADLTARLRGGAELPLAGVPFAVKESEPVRGWRSTSGDPARAGSDPATADSIQVARLRAAGAIPVAAANLALYGGWAECTNPLFGTTVNPWDSTRTPGGSSGGSAAAVAAAMVPFATASDGGGSIRIPAAACGMVGLKPTTGVVPIGDATPPTWGSLAVRAPICRSAADLATVLDVVAGADPRDPGSVRLPGSFAAAIGSMPHDRPARGGGQALRVRWSASLGYGSPDARITAACEAALAVLERGGASIDVQDDVLDADPLGAFAVPFMRAMAAEVRLGRGSGPVDDLGAEFALWVSGAASLSPTDVLAADAAGAHLRQRLDHVFAACDVLACPTVAGLPPHVPHPGAEWVQFTHPFNVSGTPALAVPVGWVWDGSARLPVSIQLAAPRLHDHRLVALGAWLEEALPPRLTDAAGGAGPPGR